MTTRETTFRESDHPGNNFSGNVFPGKKPSGKVTIRETTVYHVIRSRKQSQADNQIWTAQLYITLYTSSVQRHFTDFFMHFKNLLCIVYLYLLRFDSRFGGICDKLICHVCMQILILPVKCMLNTNTSLSLLFSDT